MKPTIETLTLAICAACIRINAAGKFHAFFEISPHVHWVSVHVTPIGQRTRVPPLLYVDASYSEDEWEHNHAKRRAGPLKRLAELKAKVEAYLPENQPQEAAA